MRSAGPKIEILLVEDNPGDAELIRIAFGEAQVLNPLRVVRDGEQAIVYLRREPPFDDASRPGLILLDLNLPRISGREVLRILKTDPDLKLIPICILTTSGDDSDILGCYRLHANSYIQKPATATELLELVQRIKQYWLQCALLPLL